VCGLLAFAVVVLLGHPFGAIRTWDEPFGFQRGAESESDGSALTIAFEVIAIAGGGTVGHSILAKG
jgi:hypothetical protein